jgi:hypothetical protein
LFVHIYETQSFYPLAPMYLTLILALSGMHLSVNGRLTPAFWFFYVWSFRLSILSWPLRNM